ncbi:MAG TPA: pyridoxamine 5'-phosphate oxidase family protein [Mycobacteriales bacterium]
MPTPPSTDVRRHPERTGDAALVRAVLDEALIVHVGTVRDGWPVVLPMAHGRDGDTLYLHGSAAAGLFRDVRGGSRVCVTATIVDALVLTRSAFNHSMNYRCAVVYGDAAPAGDLDAAVRAVVDHNLPGRHEEVRKPTEAELRETGIWQLDLTTASAKVRVGGPIEDEADLGLPAWAGVVPVTTVLGEPVPAEGVTAAIPHLRD